ncbi:multiple epidermal growth factor-like domains protein 10 [Ostrea edulis]|uniref:multiple epidermal growth factor-like domains protein 10 n=1 Tax=Ostrea edulis TaxID=37623 RepID=UPI0024AED26F|nr:multiple epidermal growth factor-like domains protein 10 [Ostrea edulis]
MYLMYSFTVVRRKHLPTVSLCMLLFVIHTETYENLAFRKPAWQQHKWPGEPLDVDWGAAKVVDGKYTDRSESGNQCAISAPGQTTATWRVDLGSVVSINHIDIYYRTDNLPSPGRYFSRFAGFFLYVSNTTSKDDGHLCFHEIQNVNGTPVENQTISCSVHGRYVIYYNERRPGVTYPSYYWHEAYNELCEVEVYGCPDPKYYGVNCDQQCPVNCQGKTCDVSTGHCLGCIPGYQGLRCSQVCDVKTYGPQCSLSCGNCSDGETCHNVNGTCLQGCDEGVEAEKCQTRQFSYKQRNIKINFLTNKLAINCTCLNEITCRPGFHGKNCGQRCSHNCNVTNHCNRFTGECDGGCKPGWKMPTCQQECDGGMYGAGCTHSCGPCLDNKQCHHVNGTCLNGCSSGHQGRHCEENCTDGHFGMNCENSCTLYCGRNGSCDRITGMCDSGCIDDWRGPLCGSAEELSSCTSCTADDSIAIILSLVISVIIVITGSVVNFVIWKRNQSENPRRGLNENSKCQLETVNNSDIQSGKDRIGSPYAELTDTNQPNMYEGIHHYTEAAGKIYDEI